MGLSTNGSEGLGGHGEGFEIQNQGVMRRAPGEGPKVNGGRAQSQELDSYDQPQYESASFDEMLQLYSEGLISEGIFTNWVQKHKAKAAGLMAGMSLMGQNGDWNQMTNATSQMGMDTPVASQVMSVKAKNPFADQDKIRVGQDADALHQASQSHEYGEKPRKQQQQQEQEMPWMGGNDADGWDRQIATGNTSGGTPVTDESFSLAEMFCLDETGVKKMRAHVDKMDKTDKHGMKDVQARMKKLVKSSEKERKEHPWATKKQAMQIAKDHEKLGESLKRTFLFKESPVRYVKGADPMNLNDPMGGGTEIPNPFDNSKQPYDSSPTRKTSKPSIEDAHGEYIVVSQFHDQIFKNKNLDEIPEPAWKAANAYVSREPSDQPGYVSYLVEEDGELTLHSANWDSSD
jgi:hypothetical protein